MNRLDTIVVFRSLNEDHLRQILNLELQAVQHRIMVSAGTKFIFQCSGEAKEMMLKEGIDFKYGARHLKRAIERLLVYPLSNLVATNQVELGDLIQVDVSPETRQLMFLKHAAGALISAIPASSVDPETVNDRSKGLGATAARESDEVGKHASE